MKILAGLVLFASTAFGQVLVQTQTWYKVADNTQTVSAVLPAGTVYRICTVITGQCIQPAVSVSSASTTLQANSAGTLTSILSILEIVNTQNINLVVGTVTSPVVIPALASVVTPGAPIPVSPVTFSGIPMNCTTGYGNDANGIETFTIVCVSPNPPVVIQDPGVTTPSSVAAPQVKK